MPKPAQTLSLFSLAERYPDEAAAVAFFERIYWAGGIHCPHCDSDSTAPRLARHGHRCKSCRRDFTVRTGTLFEDSRLPLRKWLFAMYLMQTARKGISSLQLSKELDITQKSAWFLLHRLREACDTAGEMLEGIVEVDETYLGGKEASKHNSKKRKAGRGIVGKQAVVGAKQRGGRVVAAPVDGTGTGHLQGFVRAAVQQGATVCTDEHSGYRLLPAQGYAHHTVRHSAKEYVNGMAHTNSIESVWAVLKRGYNGTYHNWSAKHCARYVNEFAFRLNEGNCRRDTMDRLAAVVHHAIGKRLTYHHLTA